jgi:hypothetical protein
MTLAICVHCYNMEVFRLFPCIGDLYLASWFELLHLFVTSFSIFVPGLDMHCHNFYRTFPGFLPRTNSDLKLYIAIVILPVRET